MNTIGHETFEATLELGVALQSEASTLASRWRRRVYAGDVGNANDRVALLEGLVEPLLVEMGRELAAGTPSATAPWARCPGLLRLSAERGARGLDEEFDLLSEVAEIFATENAASPALRRQLRIHVEASRLLALCELARAQDSNAPIPEVRFGGVKVELYEPSRKH